MTWPGPPGPSASTLTTTPLSLSHSLNWCLHVSHHKNLKADTHYLFERAVWTARSNGSCFGRPSRRPVQTAVKIFYIDARLDGPFERAVLASKCRIQSICLPILADRTVALMLQCCIRLSVVCLSMTLCIVVKRCVLEQKVNWQHIHKNIQSIYRASQKSNPPGKILYLWNCSRYIYQMCRVYRWGFSPHILQILLKWQMRFNRYNSLNFKVHFFMQSRPEYSLSLT